MSFSKLLGVMILSCLSITAGAQTVAAGQSIEIQPILLNPPILGKRPVLDFSKGQGPVKISHSGAAVASEMSSQLVLCKAFVLGRLQSDVITAENATQATDVSFQSLRSIIAVMTRLEGRHYLTSIEKELHVKMKSEMSHWDQSFREAAFSKCLDDSWSQVSRISHEQAEYLLESLDFLSVTLKM